MGPISGAREIALGLGPQRRLVLLHRPQIVGARRDDRLSDGGIAGDGVDGDERAVKVQLIEQFGDDDDLVLLLVYRLLGQDQAGVGGIGRYQMKRTLADLLVVAAP